jgi:hypothetical protein
MSYSNKTLQEYNDEEANRRLIPVIYLGLLMLIGIPGNLIVLIVYLSRRIPLMKKFGHENITAKTTQNIM